MGRSSKKRRLPDVKVFESPEGDERVLICRRSDGLFTFRRQRRSDDPLVAGSEEEAWGPPGLDCGIYDSADTAETEAMQRVPWLKGQFH